MSVLLENSDLLYAVALTDKDSTRQIILPSPLGIELQDQTFFKNLVYVGQSDLQVFEESYEMKTGKKTKNLATYSQQRFDFQNELGGKLEILFRVYDEGVAFRYVVRNEDKKDLELISERSGFKIPQRSKVWVQAYDEVTKWSPGYETYYQNGIPAGSSAPGKEGWAFPLLFSHDNIWCLISESDLRDNFCAMHLEQNAPEALYTMRLPEPEEAYDLYPTNPSTRSDEWIMPWRVIMIANNPGGILENNLVFHLASPELQGNFDWVKPGRASWSWWSDHESSKNSVSLKKFIDLAEKMKWEYSLIDANWNTIDPMEIEALIRYAKKLNIDLWFWYNSGGPHNTVEEAPRDKMHLAEDRRQEMKKLQSLGIKGLKIDFFQSDKQEIIKQYHEILKDAAEFKLMINFHGCTLPRGWERTYPHLVTSEAVKGAECYSFNDHYPENAVWHNTILPFTRNVCGPMDYTPVTFSNQTYSRKTTLGHELALSVVFETGLLHFADKPESYLTQNEQVIQFMSNIPVTWDETKYISGFPGQHVVLARRKGNTWYLGGINGTENSLALKLDLSFINTESKSMIITDKQNASGFDISESLKTSSLLEITLLPAGGFVALID
ncbi:MAG: glycoside hydrolase family 97 catalytic domain-containing protein [Cyclobacteriaceae bacterium]|nr:glycoside hydrolase family 97 catalytic domain-containing protein [Cyclobacteriaceae bacterium]